MPFLGAHGLDLIIVLVVALLVFGPKKLPEIGNAVGKTYKEFRKSITEISESVKAEVAQKEAAPTTLPAVTQPVESTVDAAK